MTVTYLPALDSDWRRRAACAGLGPDLFFDDDSTQAKEICAGCPVQSDCLDYALTAREPAGVWGGKGHGTRKGMPKPAPPRACRHCGGVFIDDSPTASYCSDDCRRAGMLRVHHEHYLRSAV